MSLVKILIELLGYIKKLEFIFLYFAIGYVFVLVGLNCIPHVNVTYIGWLSIYGITIRYHNTKVSIHGLHLRPNICWDSVITFGAVRLLVVGVKVVQNEAESPKDRDCKYSAPDIEPNLNIRFPSWVQKFILLNPCFKESAIHIKNLSIEHYALRPCWFLVGFMRLEGLKNLSGDTYGISLTTLDGYLLEGALHPKMTRTRIFHNLDSELLCEVFFSSDSSQANRRIMAQFTNFGFKAVVSDVFIPDASQFKFLHRPEVQDNNSSIAKQQLPSSSRFLRMFSLISVLQVKVEESIVNFRNLRVETTGYTVNYSKDLSFRQLAFGKFSLYVTAGKLFHLDLKCLELPSFTFLFEADITDFQRAVVSGDSTANSVDVRSSVSLTNPTFIVFFDQLPHFFKRDVNVKNHQSSNYCFNNIPYRILRKIRKASFKVVIMDTKLILHTPEKGLVAFYRDSTNNVICNGDCLLLAFKTSSENLGKLIERKCLGEVNFWTIKGYMRMRNLRFEVENNEILVSNLNSMIGYCLNNDSISMKVVSKQIYLKSANSMIFHVIKLIRETKRTQTNLACAQAADKKILESNTLETGSIPNYDIFDFLPSIVRSVRFDSDSIVTTVMCNDWLPDQVISTNGGEDINLGSYKRGVSMTIRGVSLTYKRDGQIFKTTIQQIQADTLSDLSKEYTDDWDRVRFSERDETDFEDLSSMSTSLSVLLENEIEGNIKSIKRVLFVNNIAIENPNNTTNRIDITIPEIDGRIDIFFIWCLTYAQTMIRVIAPEVKKTYSAEDEKRLHQNSKKLDISLNIKSFAMMVRVPNDVDIMLEADLLQFRLIDFEPKCQMNFLRLYVLHPATKLWIRHISIKDFHVNLNNLSRTNINLSSKAVRINIPFQFLVYTVIDNLITFFKAVRQVKHNFLNLSCGSSDFDRIMPESRPAIKVPNINWTSSIVGLTLENDAFESELALIFELANYEQVDRIRKAALFEERVKAIKSCIGESIKHESVSPRRFFKRPTIESESRTFHAFGSIKSEFARISSCPIKNYHEARSQSRKSHAKGKGTFTNQNWLKIRSQDKKSSSAGLSNSGGLPSETSETLTESAAKRIIAAAKVALDKDSATSWITKFRKFRETREANIKNHSRNVWDEDDVNLVMTSKFDIQDYSPSTPQFAGLFKNFDLSVQQAHIDDVDEFLTLHGKGQPKLQYSILIPFFLRLQSSSVHFQAKDYALPILSFPSSSTKSAPVMDFLGNFVINEKLVNRKEEMRHIFVPFSPAVEASDLVSNFYSVHIPRTLTPVKFMFDLHCGIKTDRACVLSWSKSYQPAILGILQSLDNFTKPPIDDSPLGWWDKLALIAHGKMRFDIENELCLHIKSSNSPYQLVGENSGFVFCWKNDVLLKINDTGDASELILLDSHDFILGVPNYSTAESRSWSLFYRDSHDYVYETEEESKKFQKRVVKFSSDEKVLWRLGLGFERNLDKSSTELGSNQERTNKFKPHYDVVVTNPLFDWHPDSYEDYRSDYLHMAISVCSKSSKNNSLNSAYLTPLTIKYFLAWWNTLNNSTSLPIREGKLFNSHKIEKTLVKMGAHLFTFKYQLEIEPLTVSNLHLTYEPKSKDHNVIFTGLKSKLSRCVIDLHQRKEIVRYVNDKLGIDKKVRKLKLNIGEIDLTDADIRLFYAKFRENSLRGNLMSFYVGDSHQQPNFLEKTQIEKDGHPIGGSEWKQKHIIDDETFAWVDVDDFIELEAREMLSADPIISVHPFCFTPRFTYFREFILENVESQYPFGDESSHRCLIGRQTPDQIQSMILKERVEQIKQDLTEKNEALQCLENSSDLKAKSKCALIRKELFQGNKTMDHIVSIHANLKTNLGSDIHEAESFMSKATGVTNASKSTSDDDNDYKIRRFDSNYQGSNLMKVNSAARSVYSTYNSMEQAREVVSSNASASGYHNRFLIHNLQLIWNNKVKSLFLGYLLLLSDRKAQAYSLTKSAADLVENILNRSVSEKVARDEPPPQPEETFQTNEDILNGFEEYLMKTDNTEHEIEKKFLIKFIRPQVQLISDLDTNACVLQTAQDVELRIVHVNVEGTTDIVNEDTSMIYTVATRCGLYLKDSFAFAFDKSKFTEKSFVPYGAKLNPQSWPPWVNCEECDEIFSHEEELVLDRTTMAYTFEKPNLLVLGSTNLSPIKEIKVHLGKVVINATSAQYSAIYFAVTDLFLHGYSDNDLLHQRLKQIATVSEVSDLQGYSDKVRKLQSNIHICRYILLKMDERTVILSKREQRERAIVEIEIERMRLELEVIIQMIQLAGDRASIVKDLSRNWKINADQIIWHILDNNREPLVDFALASSTFSRTDKLDGSNSNVLEISMLQGFNLQHNALYPELFRPCLEFFETKSAETFDSREPIIQMKWQMLNPVGGINVMKNAELRIQPVHIQLDYETGNKIFNYLFPKEEELGRETLLLEDEGDVSSVTSTTSPETSNPFRKLIARNSSSVSSGGNRSSQSSKVEQSEDSSLENLSFNSSLNGASGRSTSVLKKRHRVEKQPAVDDISLIMNRSSKYIAIEELCVHKVRMCVSFKAPKHLNIVDVHNLQLSVPSIIYRNKTWSGHDLAVHLKKDIIHIILNHSGKIIGNKFKVRKRKESEGPLKQISDYSLYISLDELQKDGHSRGDVYVRHSVSQNLEAENPKLIIDHSDGIKEVLNTATKAARLRPSPLLKSESSPGIHQRFK